jgi:hypothetical protein
MNADSTYTCGQKRKKKNPGFMNYRLMHPYCNTGNTHVQCITTKTPGTTYAKKAWHK